jgi:GNAT superfamily N-acetyltransferase
VIRAATPEDAEAMLALTKRAWVRNWSDFVDPAVMLAQAEESGTGPYLRSIGDPAREVLVLEVDGAVVGHLLIVGDEIRAFYVDPPAQGAGAGTQLLVAAEERIRAAGHATAQLHVFDENHQARVFYERRGWTTDGAPPVLRERDWAPSVHYVKAL